MKRSELEYVGVSVAIFGRIVFWRHNQTSSLSCSAVNSLDNVDHLLLVLHCPVDLVVVASSQVNHDVLVAEEEHNSAGIVKLIHFVEIRDLGNVDEVNDAKVLDFFSDGEQGFVHFHARRIPVMAESNKDDLVLLRKNSLVNLPAIGEMGEHKRHDGWLVLLLVLLSFLSCCVLE